MSRRPSRLQVFAAEDTAVQVTWRALPAGARILQVGPAAEDVGGHSGAGAALFTGLTPDTHYRVLLDGEPVAACRTAPALGGPPLARIATISDLHIGQTSCGLLPTLRDAHDEEPHPTRCLRAAIAELQEWGADLLVVKGDVSDGSRAEQYETAARELKAADIPLLVIPGNHDGASHPGHDIVACLGTHGIEVTTDVAFVDLPGVRVIVAGTNHRNGRHWAQLPPERIDAIAAAAGGAPGPCLLAVHHAIQLTYVPTYWPMGVWGSAPRRLLRAVHEANPATFVTTGHSHRHRRHAWRGIPITDVGSTKDHPGVWGAYTVHADGIRQTVRRIAQPDVISWTERTADILFGQWGRWSPGRLDDRCVTHRWPGR